jgi:hypothetical protein
LGEPHGLPLGPERRKPHRSLWIPLLVVSYLQPPCFV